MWNAVLMRDATSTRGSRDKSRFEVRRAFFSYSKHLGLNYLRLLPNPRYPSARKRRVATILQAKTRGFKAPGVQRLSECRPGGNLRQYWSIVYVVAPGRRIRANSSALHTAILKACGFY